MSINQTNKSMSVTLKGAKKVVKFLKKADAHTKKSLNTAIKVEGFRLKKLLQKEIRSGSPGGSRFNVLSFIARKIDRRSPNRKPLTRLAAGVRYHVKSYKPFQLEVGWPEGNKGSNSWRRLALMLQKGFTKSISKKQRSFILHKGSKLGTIEGGETPFFLRKSTKSFKTPERQIISPFWQANRSKANQNIKRNFKLKLKGAKI